MSSKDIQTPPALAQARAHTQIHRPVGKDENVVGIPYSVRLSRSLQQLLLNNVLTNPEERIFVKDLDSKFIFVNQCFLADNGTGLGMDQLIGKTDADLFTNEHAQAARFDEEQVMATRLPILSKLERETFTDRDDKWVTTSKFPLHDDDGTVIGTWGVSRDITKQVQAQLATAEKLQASEGQHRLLFERNPQPVWVLDLETQKILAASNAAVSDYGYTREELLQMTYSDLCPPKDAKATNLRRPTGELDTEQADLTCHQYKDGTIIEVEVFGENVILEGRSCRIALTQNVTERNRAASELAVARDHAIEVSLRDVVTGLPNRKALMERLTSVLAQPREENHKIGLLFLDLDNFKDINDSLSHDIGDLVLVEIGRRLSKIAREIDIVARLGGDEFVLVCSQLKDKAAAKHIGQRVIETIRKPMTIGEHTIVVAGSLGVLIASNGSASELLRRVDIAMYSAKSAGRNRLSVFDAEDENGLDLNGSLALDLRRALNEREFVVAYQPIFSLSDGDVSSVEALVRWQHPQRGLISPDDFIPLAEERGLIAEITSFVLDEACQQLAAWRELGDHWQDLIVGVNISGRELNDPTLINRVASTIQQHKIPPSRLGLEITETSFIDEIDTAHQVVEALRKIGVRLALDDFGTGHSTLTHLQFFDVDTLKIDRSFIAKLSDNSRESGIIGAVVAMGHALGLRMIGEGIETKEQLRELVDLGCERGQGFIYARPMNPEDVVVCKETAYARAQQARASEQSWVELFSPLS